MSFSIQGRSDPLIRAASQCAAPGRAPAAGTGGSTVRHKSGEDKVRAAAAREARAPSSS